MCVQLHYQLCNVYVVWVPQITIAVHSFLSCIIVVLVKSLCYHSSVVFLTDLPEGDPEGDLPVQHEGTPQEHVGTET